MLAVFGAAARFLTRVAAIFLLGMVAINVVDVGLRSGFNAPIFGAYEIVEFMLAAAAFLAIPEVFLRDAHITIELIDQVLPARVVDVLRAIGTVCALVFVGLLTWHMIRPALDYIEFNEVTMDLQLPMIWKAVPIIIAFGVSVLTAFALLLRDVGRVMGRGA
jgi:TRAP-type C4-dicarboxylate transport system permease small subunit